ncbi:hypothetical protein [Salininema proteolyticum]|uniref:Integral membrane protein n=1 Tax=Salininema proteolyticum TaxID=1607685 RepID=A0ABV8U4G8_9ACTN
MSADARGQSPLSAEERDELERLRRRVEQLEAGPKSGGSGRAGRWALAAVVLLTAAVFAVASVLTVWLKGTVLDTDRYVATVAPLIEEPTVQEGVTQRITEAVMAEVDVEGVVRELADNLEEQGAPQAVGSLVDPMVSGVESFVEKQVGSVVASDRFADVWETANRAVHRQLVAELQGGGSDLIAVEGDAITVDLGQGVDLVKERLVDAGFGLASNIPDVSIPYTLVSSDQVSTVQAALKALNTAAWVFPILAVVLLAFGIWLAPRRRGGAIAAGVMIVFFALLSMAALAAARQAYVNALPEGLGVESAGAAWDVLTRFLWSALQRVAVVAAIAGIAVWLTGRGPAATAIRNGTSRALAATGSGLARLGLSLGPVSGFLARSGRTIAVVIAVLGVAALFLWPRPGVAGLMWILVVTLTLLALIGIGAHVRPAEKRGTP